MVTMTSSASRLRADGAGVLHAGRWLWLRTVAWMALLFALTSAAFVASLLLTSWLPALEGHGRAIALLLPAAMVIGYAVLVRVGERRPANELRLARAPIELAVGAAVGFAFISGALLMLCALGVYEVRVGTWRDALHSFIFNAYVSAVLEELAFRGILLRLLARMFGELPALILSSVLFGLAHASHASPIAMAELMVNGGGIFGLLYLASGWLWLSIGAHLAYDFTEWSLMGIGNSDGLLASTPVANTPAWLSGGSFGPDGSVLAVVVGALLIWIIAATHSRRLGSAARDLQKRTS